MSKRVISAILAAALLLAFAPFAASAAHSKAYETTVYSFDFETDPSANGWSTADMDNDGHSWVYDRYYADAHSGTGLMWSASYDNEDEALTPNNRLVSPVIEIPAEGETTIKVMARGYHPRDFAEHFRFAYVIDGGDTVPTSIGYEDFVTTNEWKEYSVTISPDDPIRSHLLGKRIRVVISHWCCTNQFRLLVDDFSVTNYNPVKHVISTDFEATPFARGWSTLDIDGDGRAWEFVSDAGTLDTPSHSGTGVMMSESWNRDDGALTPNNRLITPFFTVPAYGKMTLSFWARGDHNDDFAEQFDISYIEYNAGNAIPNTISPTYTTENRWNEYTFDLSGYNDGKLLGRRIRLVISHLPSSTDNYRLLLDDFGIKWDAQPDSGVVYAFNFESDPFINDWTREDLDGDGNGWTYENSRLSAYTYDDYAYTYSYSGSGSVFSASYWKGAALTPVNRLTSPYFTVPDEGDTFVTFRARGSDTNDFKEHFTVGYQVMGDIRLVLPGSFTTENEWKEYTVKLPDGLNGKNVRIYITHIDSTDQLRLYVDDFVVRSGSAALRGDFDKDGEITVSDALAALRIAAKLAEETSEAITIGDIDKDGSVTVADALAILRVAAKLADVSSLQ